MQITIQDLVEHFHLQLLAGEEGLNHSLQVTDIKRPGIELAGYWEHFTPERVQLLGRTEITFLHNLPAGLRKERLEKFFSYPLPGVIVTRDLNPPEVMLQLANQYQISLLKTPTSTTHFLSKLTDFLEKKLAPTETVHGVLVEVYGVGVLLIGESGIGKSETALELVKRGHRLVADDMVEIYRIGSNTLVGSAPRLSRHYMELRGIGIIDVKTLFGAGAVKMEQKIQLILELRDWGRDQEDDYDRLGLSSKRYPILDLEVEKVAIPVRPGRNLTTIVEVAAMNHRLLYMGYNAAQTFTQNLEAEIALKKEKKLLKGEKS